MTRKKALALELEADRLAAGECVDSLFVSRKRRRPMKSVIESVRVLAAVLLASPRGQRSSG